MYSLADLVFAGLILCSFQCISGLLIAECYIYRWLFIHIMVKLVLELIKGTVRLKSQMELHIKKVI